MDLLARQLNAIGRPDLIPTALLCEQPKLAAYIAKHWGSEALAQTIFDLLLSDREQLVAGVADFSPQVIRELMSISVIYPDLLPQILSTKDVWANEREVEAEAQLPFLGYINRGQVNKDSPGYTMPGYMDSPPTIIPSMQNDAEWSPLMQASFAGRTAQVANLLAKKVNASSVDRDGYQALHLAAIQGELAVLSLLLAYGVDPNVLSQRQASPLLLAAASGHDAVVDALISAGANIDLARDDGWTALHKAVANGHDAVVISLLEAGANPVLETKTGQTAFTLVPENKNRMAELLFSAKPGQQMRVLETREIVSQPHIDWGCH
jgi:hypothetical protein